MQAAAPAPGPSTGGEAAVPASSAIHSLAAMTAKRASRRKKLGISNLRLKGAADITSAAQRLQRWEGELQEQEELLEQYQAIVAQRERALLVAEAKVIRRQRELDEGAAALTADRAKLDSATSEVHELAAWQREQTVKIRAEQAEIKAQGAETTKVRQELQSREDVLRRKHELSSELLEALKTREAQCQTREAEVEENATSLAQRQVVLSEWQAQVERLVDSLSQRAATTTGQFHSTVPQNSPISAGKHAILDARRDGLQHRVDQLDKLESQLRNRERQAEMRMSALNRTDKASQTLQQPSPQKPAFAAVPPEDIERLHRDVQTTERARIELEMKAAIDELNARRHAVELAEAQCDEAQEAAAQAIREERRLCEEEHMAARAEFGELVYMRRPQMPLCLTILHHVEAEQASTSQKERALIAYESRLLGREAAVANKERALALREHQLEEERADVVSQRNEANEVMATARKQIGAAAQQVDTSHPCMPQAPV